MSEKYVLRPLWQIEFIANEIGCEVHTLLCGTSDGKVCGIDLFEDEFVKIENAGSTDRFESVSSRWGISMHEKEPIAKFIELRDLFTRPGERWPDLILKDGRAYSFGDREGDVTRFVPSGLVRCDGQAVHVETSFSFSGFSREDLKINTDRDEIKGVFNWL